MSLQERFLSLQWTFEFSLVITKLSHFVAWHRSVLVTRVRGETRGARGILFSSENALPLQRLPWYLFLQVLSLPWLRSFLQTSNTFSNSYLLPPHMLSDVIVEVLPLSLLLCFSHTSNTVCNLSYDYSCSFACFRW